MKSLRIRMNMETCQLYTKAHIKKKSLLALSHHTRFASYFQVNLTAELFPAHNPISENQDFVHPLAQFCCQNISNLILGSQHNRCIPNSKEQSLESGKIIPVCNHFQLFRPCRISIPSSKERQNECNQHVDDNLFICVYPIFISFINNSRWQTYLILLSPFFPFQQQPCEVG